MVAACGLKHAVFLPAFSLEGGEACGILLSERERERVP